MNNPPRILYVTKILPHPPDVGVRQRILNVGRLLARAGPVTLLCLAKHRPESAITATRAEFDRLVMMDSLPWREPWTRRLRQVLGPLQEPISYLSPADRQHFEQLLASHDMVWLHDRFLANLFGIYRFDRSVLDIDDLEHVKLSLQANMARGHFERFRLRRQARKCRLAELDLQNRFSLLTVCSEADRSYLKRFMDAARIHVIPNGYEAPVTPPSGDRPVLCRIGFVGHLAYPPNGEGLHWFIREVWPRVRSKVPAARLRIMGRPPADAEFLVAEGVDALGFVDDSAPEIATWNAMVVPLHIGGGTRIKIIEAFSRGCPVVSTTVGAHGIQVASGRELLIADDPDDFARHCVSLLVEPGSGRPLAEAAWEVFVDRYSWDRIYPAVQVAVEAAMTMR